MQTQERRERKGTKTEGRGARTRCTVGLMVAYASQTWSGEEHVSVTVQRRLRQCTSLRSAQPAATSYMRMRRSCWNAAARGAPARVRVQAPGLLACGSAHALLGGEAATRGARIAQARTTALGNPGNAGRTLGHFRHAGEQAARPCMSPVVEHTQGLQVYHRMHGHSAHAQGVCRTGRRLAVAAPRRLSGSSARPPGGLPAADSDATTQGAWGRGEAAGRGGAALRRGPAAHQRTGRRWLRTGPCTRASACFPRSWSRRWAAGGTR